MTKHFLARLSDKRRELMTAELVTAHVDYLRGLRLDGVLELCGPCADDTALIVLRCSTAAEAERFVEDDPFSKAGYYGSRQIVEFTPADDSNNYHLDTVLERLQGATR